MLLHGALIGVLVYGYLQFRKPPPPVTAVALPQSVSERTQPPAIAVLAAGPETKSHRSRAPPLTA